MEHANYMEISLAALERNAKTLMESVSVPVIAVVKCDGYGTGIVTAAKAWQSAGAKMFAVSEPWEALALRENGFTEDILLMAPVADTETLSALLEKGIILTVTDTGNARFYCEHRGEHTLRVHIKVDTGMGRFGIPWDCTQELLEVYGMEGLQIEGIFSHFGKSFEKAYDLTGKQLAQFLLAVKGVEDAGFKPGIRHIANSCAALRFPQTHLDAVRIGSGLVGALIAPVPVKLERVHTFKAQVVAVRTLKKGDTTGYASVYKMKKDAKILVAAVGQDCGFALAGEPDPYPVRDFLFYLRDLYRRWKNPHKVTFNGKSGALIGRVGSQYTVFLADGMDVKPGDYVDVPVNLLRNKAARIYK